MILFPSIFNPYSKKFYATSICAILRFIPLFLQQFKLGVTFRLRGRRMRDAGLACGSDSRMVRIPKYSAFTDRPAPVAAPSSPWLTPVAKGAAWLRPLGVSGRILRASNHSSNVATSQACVPHPAGFLWLCVPRTISKCKTADGWLKRFYEAVLCIAITYRIPVVTPANTSTSIIKYLIVSRRIFFRECMAKTGGVPGYIEDFCHVLSEK